MRKNKFWKSVISTVLVLSMLSSVGEMTVMGETPETLAAEGKSEVGLHLQYDEPAKDWESQALPIGNGKMAAMVFGGVESDTIQFNEETVWSGGPGSTKKYKGGENNYTTEVVHKALTETRNQLQQMVTEFKDKNSAHLNEKGNIVSKNYTDLLTKDSTFKKNLSKLKGSRTNYGSYQSVGNIVIDDLDNGKQTGDGTDTPDYTNYVRTLNIDKAVETVFYEKDGVHYTREYFASNPSNVIAVRLSADKKGKLSKDISFTTEQTQKKIVADAKEGIIELTGNPSNHNQSKKLEYACQLKVVPENGTIENKDDTTLSVKNADAIVLFLAVTTNYQTDPSENYNFLSDKDPMLATEKNINAAVEKGYTALYEEHITDYSKLYDRVKVNFDVNTMPNKMTDDLLKEYGKTNTEEEDRYMDMLFFQYGRYLLIASSRENSVLPANLQGKWSQGLSPAWDADYHTNINLQMNYWPAEQTNLEECHIPLVNFVNNLVEKGKKTAKKYYCKEDGSNVRGWVIHHENNIWGHTNPGTFDTAFYFPAAAAWMCQDIWETYQYNDDKSFLEKNYRTLLDAALFWVDNLWVDKRDGKLVANPSYSPEHGAYSIGCTSDQAIIWELFEEVKLASQILGKTENPEVKEVLAAQKKLYMPKSNTLGGQYREWKDETTLEIKNSDQHRHQNQLFVLHPGTYLIAGRSTLDDSELAAAKKTLEVRGDGGTGWSKAWKINMWARLRDGNRAKKLLDEQIKGSTLENLFDTHPPFQIDGNFGATAGVAEMLLQSHGEYIEPLAALPSTWSKGEAKGLKARGNFVFNCQWDAGKATSLEITSQSGKECKVKYRRINEAKIINKETGKEIEDVTREQGIVTFATEQDATYVFENLSAEEGGEAIVPVKTAEPEEPYITPTPVVTPTATPTPTAVPTAVPTLLPQPTQTTDMKSNPNEENKIAKKITLGKGKIKKLKKKKKKLVVTYSKVKNAAGYEIQYSTKKNMKKGKIVRVKKGTITSKQITGLKKKKYFVRVRAFTYQGKKKIYGKWSNKKSIRMK